MSIDIRQITTEYIESQESLSIASKLKAQGARELYELIRQKAAEDEQGRPTEVKGSKPGRGEKSKKQTSK